MAAWFEFQEEQGPETGGFKQNRNMQHGGAKSGMCRGDFPKACLLLNSASSARNFGIQGKLQLNLAVSPTDFRRTISNL